MDAVIDTNVLVSGLLNPAGYPGGIIDVIFSRRVLVAYDDRVMSEYEKVLPRPKFEFPAGSVKELLSAIHTFGLRIVPVRTTVPLPDAKDRCFLECALALAPPILISGNLRHYPPALCSPVHVLTPRDFISTYC
jgi:putative PIN family toxin of toxin-antitoxin system